jgi:hypothetical protein
MAERDAASNVAPAKPSPAKGRKVS